LTRRPHWAGEVDRNHGSVIVLCWPSSMRM